MKATYVDHMGSDLSVVNAARVSFNKKSDWNYSQGGTGPVSLKDEDVRLINYLARHKHKSPFNHSYITLHIKAPIFVARQLVKHKFMPWNEVSRRYVNEEPEFYFPEKWRKAAENVKQGSSDEAVEQVAFYSYGETWREDPGSVYSAACDSWKMYYKSLIDGGVAPEQARMVLPQSAYTEWYWSGTLGAWADMYNLRAESSSQRETQEIARQAGNIISKLFPVSWEALTKEVK